jgi:succinate dehydrogenase/fumarate reductase cytochrome b subunit
MNIDRTLKLIQSTTGIFISSFTILHAAGHFLSLASFKLANQSLLATREIFHIIPIETCLFASIAIHLISGIILGVRRKKLTANTIQATGGVLLFS